MKNCLLILLTVLSSVSVVFSQNNMQEKTTLNSTVYFKFNSFQSPIIGNKFLLNPDSSINETNLEFVINHLNNSILNDSLEPQVKVGYSVSREEYTNMSSSKKSDLNNFIEALHAYIDALEPIHYPKKFGYFLPNNEIESLLNILELN